MHETDPLIICRIPRNSKWDEAEYLRDGLNLTHLINVTGRVPREADSTGFPVEHLAGSYTYWGATPVGDKGRSTGQTSHYKVSADLAGQGNGSLYPCINQRYMSAAPGRGRDLRWDHSLQLQAVFWERLGWKLADANVPRSWGNGCFCPERIGGGVRSGVGGGYLSAWRQHPLQLGTTECCRWVSCPVGWPRLWGTNQLQG